MVPPTAVPATRSTPLLTVVSTFSDSTTATCAWQAASVGSSGRPSLTYSYTHLQTGSLCTYRSHCCNRHMRICIFVRREYGMAVHRGHCIQRNPGVEARAVVGGTENQAQHARRRAKKFEKEVQPPVLPPPAMHAPPFRHKHTRLEAPQFSRQKETHSLYLYCEEEDHSGDMYQYLSVHDGYDWGTVWV